MSFHFADIARAAAEDGAIAEPEILALRRAGWGDGAFSRAEAEALFAAHRASKGHSTAWSDFFTEAMRQHLLGQCEPRGYLADHDAQWLIGQVTADGRVCSLTELELLVSVLERAHNTPAALKSFILETIEREVMEGTGPTRCGGTLEPTHVTSAECRLLRRAIFAAGGDRPAAVSLAEAEMLFRLKDASLHHANAPEFERLFVQGVASYLTGHSSDLAQLSAERAAQLEAFVANRDHGVGRFLGQMARSAPDALGVVFGRRRIAPGTGRAAATAVAAQLTSGERAWLDARIDDNGEIDAYDRALIAFLAEEAER